MYCLVVVQLSWHVACGIGFLIRIKPMSYLEDEFLTAGPPGSPLPLDFLKWFQRPYIPSQIKSSRNEMLLSLHQNPGTSCYWARQESYDHPWTNACGQGSVMCWGICAPLYSWFQDPWSTWAEREDLGRFPENAWKPVKIRWGCVQASKTTVTWTWSGILLNYFWFTLFLSSYQFLSCQVNVVTMRRQLNDNGAFLPVYLVILAEMLKDRDTHRWVWAGPWILPLVSENACCWLADGDWTELNPKGTLRLLYLYSKAIWENSGMAESRSSNEVISQLTPASVFWFSILYLYWLKSWMSCTVPTWLHHLFTCDLAWKISHFKYFSLAWKFLRFPLTVPA